ncbi:hypothetical protein PSTG_09984 [Puccinia striiformis f. sp. tritici PST-78]|uniref:Uncharacterized protein n=1 Tax=Puccinia striiformis f. sp. tritici PST-78 TaxID=1165861 RepID=A0A0L0VBS0_9BASI|nr:hypothetical protein PSTG_09984 [Puccinia striiformis f. sp. tritici PST-78]
MKAQAEQLAAKEEKIKKAHQRMKELRATLVRYWDRNIRNTMGKIIQNKWNGLYKVIKQINRGPYILAELDGMELARSSAANHIKKFYLRGEAGEEGWKKTESTSEEEEEAIIKEEEQEEEKTE